MNTSVPNIDEYYYLLSTDTMLLPKTQWKSTYKAPKKDNCCLKLTQMSN